MSRSVGPAEDGEGQQAGGEPGVEDVGLLRDVGDAAALAQAVGRFARDGDFAAGRAVPGGDAMAPPELAGDAPVVDVRHPLDVGLAVLLGGELDVALLDGRDGLVRRAAGSLTNHCVERRGSTTTSCSGRDVPIAWVWSLMSTRSPAASRSATMRLRASKRSRPCVGASRRH